MATEVRQVESFKARRGAALVAVLLGIVVTVAGCKVSKGGKCAKPEDCASGLSCAANNTCQTPDGAKCAGRADCKSHGLCSADEAGRCVPGGDGDCRASEGCAEYGECSLLTAELTVTKTSVLAQTVAPKSEPGSATAAGSTGCGARTNADCRESRACRLWGYCTAANGRCRPASADDCKGSNVCRSYGRCSVQTDQTACMRCTTLSSEEEMGRKMRAEPDEHAFVVGGMAMGGTGGCCCK